MKKIIYISLSRIHSFYKNNLVIFIIFLIGCALSTFTFIYFWGNSLPHMVNSAKDSYSYSNYTVIFHEPLEVNKILTAVKDDNSLDKVFVRKQITSNDIECETPYSPENLSGRENYYVIAEISDSPDYNIWRGDIDPFDNDDNKSVLVSEYIFRPSAPLGNLYIGDKEYSVVGEYVAGTEISVTLRYDEFASDFRYADSISFSFKEKLSSAENSKFIKNTEQQYSETVAEIISAAEIYRSSDTIIYLGMICAVYIIAVLSYIYIFKDLIEYNFSETVIYSIMGAKPKTVFLIMLCDNAIISAAIGILTCLIHSLLYENVFSFINMFDGIQYSFWDYTAITILVSVLSSIVLLPFIFKYRNKEIIVLKNNYTD